MSNPYLEGLPENAKVLVELLGKPEKGELNYDKQDRRVTRLEAIRELKNLEAHGIIPPPKKVKGVNVHVHTSESFSVFRSPSEAAWAGYRAGLEVFGINDHYTIDGHREFGEACRILDLKAGLSVEVMAMHEKARENGERTNDPLNPGRTYLCGKGVVHDLEPGSSSEELLKTMRNAFRKRCEEMTEKVNAFLESANSSLGLSFDDVLRLTPRGNVTERHIAQAVTILISNKFPEKMSRKAFLKKLIGEFDDNDLCREDLFQDLIRNRILKAGGPAYVEEPAEAFPGIEDIVQLFRDYGAIPTYPVLGNPVTEKEKYLDSLFDELEGYGIFAVEVIPKRNTRRRLQEILKNAEKHGFPVFSGTENNTKTVEPLLDELSADPVFLPVLRQGAYLILGHQFLSKYAGKGYINQNGCLTFKDKKTGGSFFSFAGRLIWPREVLEWFNMIGQEQTYKIVLGLHQVLGQKRTGCCRVKPGFKVPDGLLDGTQVVNDHLQLIDTKAKKELERLVRDYIIEEL
jgi:hypothetical protein